MQIVDVGRPDIIETRNFGNHIVLHRSGDSDTLAGLVVYRICVPDVFEIDAVDNYRPA